MENSTFSILSVLRRTLSILNQHYGLILPLALIGSLPLEVFLPIDEGGRPSWANGFILIFASLVLAALTTGAIACAVFSILRGGPATLVEALKRGAARGGHATLASILVGLCLLGSFILLVVPGFIVFCMLAVSLQACVLEGLKPMASLKRSRELTKGHRLAIFVLLILVIIGAIVLGFLISLIGAIFLHGTENVIFAMLLDCLGTLPGVALSCTMFAVIYSDLRSIKDGSGLGAAVKVFD